MMLHKLALFAASAALAPLATGLMRASTLHTQRVGPGSAHPQIARPYNPGQSRRSFMRWAMLGGLLVGGAQFGLVFVRFFWPNRVEAFGTELLFGPVTAAPAVGAAPVRNDPGRFWLIQNEDGLMAFYWKCTHLGCTVPWAEGANIFRCPCHGSEFDRRGLVVGGPAPRPMDTMSVRIDGNNILVNTGEITQRTGFDENQVTPI